MWANPLPHRTHDWFEFYCLCCIHEKGCRLFSFDELWQLKNPKKRSRWSCFLSLCLKIPETQATVQWQWWPPHRQPTPALTPAEEAMSQTPLWFLKFLLLTFSFLLHPSASPRNVPRSWCCLSYHSLQLVLWISPRQAKCKYVKTERNRSG